MGRDRLYPGILFIISTLSTVSQPAGEDPSGSSLQRMGETKKAREKEGRYPMERIDGHYLGEMR